MQFALASKPGAMPTRFEADGRQCTAASISSSAARNFEARIKDPVKHWKLSPMDTESVRRWWDYTAAYQRMIKATHTPEAPWYIVPADDKRRARLNLIRHLLDSIPYKKVSIDLPKIPKAQTRPKVPPEA